LRNDYNQHFSNKHEKEYILIIKNPLGNMENSQINLKGEIKSKNGNDIDTETTSVKVKLRHLLYVIGVIAIGAFSWYQGGLNKEISGKLDKSEYNATHKADSIDLIHYKEQVQTTFNQRGKLIGELRHNLKKLFRDKYQLNYDEMGDDGKFENVDGTPIKEEK